MKKFVSLLLSLCMVVSLAACGGSNDNSAANDPSATVDQPESSGDGEEASGDGSYELAVVTDANSIDDRGFNQGAWEGLSQYAKEHDITHQYYRPIDQSTNGYLVAIETAINNGAKLVVCPGFSFEAAVYQAQDLYPEVKFIILDGTPQDGTYTDYKTADNTYSIVFAEDQSGFLAGYAAVKDGYTKLGMFGALAVPAVVRFGHGFVQGAEYAAKEMGLDAGSIECKYTYTGTFDVLPENQTKAASWYQSGTEVIFADGTPDNVFAAAESVEGSASIGVDLDQSTSSETVVTSAMKNLSIAIYNGIEKFYNDAFPGGQNVTLGVEDNAVGLPMETSRFRTFSQADYDGIYQKMIDDTDGIRTGMRKDVDADGNSITTADLADAMTYVSIIEVS